jgi:hypothetical protein
MPSYSPFLLFIYIATVYQPLGQVPYTLHSALYGCSTTSETMELWLTSFSNVNIQTKQKSWELIVLQMEKMYLESGIVRMCMYKKDCY